jgi:hypothetical protein
MGQARYENEWRRLGYDKGMGSASVVCPPNEDFIRAYHLTSADHGISSISLRRLKVALFSEVNDPFELLGLNFHERTTRKIVRQFKALRNSKTGLVCFSANWTNPVLWSHYATRHRGICLGFDLRKTEVQRVNYEDDRLREKLNDNADPSALPSELQDLLLRTKFSHWRYEEELRMFVELSRAKKEHGLHFWPFSTDLRLAEVILGPLCEVPLASIRELTDATNVQAVVFKARLAFRSFRVVPDGRYMPNND